MSGIITTESSRNQDPQDPSSSTSPAPPPPPRYPHVPHSLRAPEVVAKRNARERRRVEAVNRAFCRLRQRLPPLLQRHRRLSKAKTLQRAIDYIKHLQGLLQQQQEEEEVEESPALQTSPPSAGTTCSVDQYYPLSQTRELIQTQGPLVLHTAADLNQNYQYTQQLSPEDCLLPPLQNSTTQASSAHQEQWGLQHALLFQMQTLPGEMSELSSNEPFEI